MRLGSWVATMREASWRTLGLESARQRQDLVVAGLRLREQRREGRDGRVLDAVRVVAAVLEQWPDVRLVGVLREDLHGAEAQLLVVVVERVQGDRRDPRRGDRLDDREGLLAHGRLSAARVIVRAIQGSARSFGFLRR